MIVQNRDVQNRRSFETIFYWPLLLSFYNSLTLWQRRKKALTVELGKETAVKNGNNALILFVANQAAKTLPQFDNSLWNGIFLEWVFTFLPNRLYSCFG